MKTNKLFLVIFVLFLSTDIFANLPDVFNKAFWIIESKSDRYNSFQIEEKITKTSKVLNVLVSYNKERGLQVLIIDEKTFPYFYSDENKNLTVYYDLKTNKYFRIKDEYLKLNLKVLKGKKADFSWLFYKEKVKDNCSFNFVEILDIFREESENIKSDNNAYELLTKDNKKIVIHFMELKLSSITFENKKKKQKTEYKNIQFDKIDNSFLPKDIIEKIINNSTQIDIEPLDFQKKFEILYAFLLKRTLG